MPFGYIKKYTQADIINGLEEGAEEGRIIAYNTTLNKFTPTLIPPRVITNFAGTITNVQPASTRWVRWGANTDGVADTVLVPPNAIYLGFSYSFNDSTAITTVLGSTMSIEVGCVYDTVAANILCSNSSANFHTAEITTLGQAEIDAMAGFPQGISLVDELVTFPDATRLSARVVTTGTNTYNNGDINIVVFFGLNTAGYFD